MTSTAVPRSATVGGSRGPVDGRDPFAVVHEWATRQPGAVVAVKRLVGAEYLEIATAPGSRLAIEVLDHVVPIATLALRTRAHQAAGRNVSWLFTGPAHPRLRLTATHLEAATGGAPVVGLTGRRVTVAAPSPRDGAAELDLESMCLSGGRLEPSWWDLAAEAEAEHRDTVRQQEANRAAIDYARRLETVRAARDAAAEADAQAVRQAGSAANRTGALSVRYDRYSDPVRPPRPGDPGCGGCGGRLDPSLFGVGYHFGCEEPERADAVPSEAERTSSPAADAASTTVRGTADGVPHTHTS